MIVYNIVVFNMFGQALVRGDMKGFRIKFEGKVYDLCLKEGFVHVIFGYMHQSFDLYVGGRTHGRSYTWLDVVGMREDISIEVVFKECLCDSEQGGICLMQDYGENMLSKDERNLLENKRLIINFNDEVFCVAVEEGACGLNLSCSNDRDIAEYSINGYNSGNCYHWAKGNLQDGDSFRIRLSETSEISPCEIVEFKIE